MKKVITLLLVLMMSLTLLPKPETYAIPVAEIAGEKGELRATWLSHFIGSMPSYTTEAAFKTKANEILNIMEYNKINAMIIHFRTHNNALYESDLNPQASWFGLVNYDNFDPMAWLIEEAHSRGIEFHAWFNPYRLNQSYVFGSLPAENPANDPANILVGTNGSILNPGLPVVRQFVVDTIMEVVERYDIDAVHFDDYFYMNLGTNGSNIISEPDQATFLANPMGFPNTNAGKADWRREQVNLLIQGIDDALENFNQANNRHIQFGISPTGIYKNGNGVVTYDQLGKPITTGSNTGGQTHYSSYLFADSLKWISEGWLDYIMPQSYWATTHAVAAFPNVMGWWNDVVKYLDVNLYSGIGVYMANSSTSYSWSTDPNEFVSQLNQLDQMENTSGFSIYSYNMVERAYNNFNEFSKTQINNARAAHLLSYAVLPEIKSMTPVHLDVVSGITHNSSNGILSFDADPLAKFYYIYKSNGPLTYENTEIVDVISSDELATVTWNSGDTSTSNHYGVRALSHTNHLSPTSQTNVAAPTVNLSGTWSGINYTSEVLMTLTASDSISYSFDKTNWESYVEPINVDSNGSYEIYFKATNNLNVDSPVYKINFDVAIVNNSVPIIQITGQQSGGSYLTGSTITVTAPSNQIWIKINKGNVGPWQEYTGPITLLEKGNYAIFAKTVTTGGVESTEQQLNVSITSVYDSPIIEIAGDGIDPYYQWVEVTLSFDPNAPQPRYRMNGGAWQTYTEPMLYELPGNFTLEVRNGIGEPLYSKSFHIVKDPIDPVSTITGTLDGMYYIDETEVSLSTTSLVDTILYRVHNGASWSSWATYTDSLVFNTNATYTVEYKAVNQAGIETEVLEERIRLNIPAVEDNEFVIRNGQNVYYYQTDTPVTLPTTYTEKTSEIRAVWVATVSNIDIEKHTSETDYKNKLNAILDRLEALKFNTLFFQTRPMNDSFYPSEFAPMSRYLSGSEGTDIGWDMFEYLITEAHKRGIEVHAWMNPYRVATGSGTKAEQLALLHDSNFAKQNPSYVIQDTNGALILNPGIPAVRTYLNNIVDELMENYKVDGVHFDDYFYSYNGTPQVEDSEAFGLYNPNSLSLDDWRRDNVNKLVESIFNQVESFNTSKDKHVKFGISPFGIWKNKTSDPLGSNSNGLQSYSAQYADSRKWVKEGWLHYIMPQLYWPFNHSTARFADLVDWWVDVVKDTDVDLVIGQGFYRYAESSNNWPDESEFLEQLRYMSQYDEIIGSSLFSYKTLNSSHDLVTKALTRLGNHYWTNEVTHTWETHMNDQENPGPDPDPDPDPDPVDENPGLTTMELGVIVGGVVLTLAIMGGIVLFIVKKRP